MRTAGPGLAAKACPTAPARSTAGMRAQGGPGLAGWAGLRGAGDQPCCGAAGAGTDGPSSWNGVLGCGQ